MTEAEALEIADKPDWWMGPDRGHKGMRTLRDALSAALEYGERAYLFRPGGEQTRAKWLSADHVVRFYIALSGESMRAA